MNILTMEQITKAFGERKVLDGASFFLQEGEKVGVLGINGTGKSTFLKLMVGLEEPDTGKIYKANHIVIRYLPQHPEFDSDDTVLTAVLKGHDTESKEIDAKSMLTKLGVTEFDMPCKHLSGGQKKRLALVATLISDADILVLDEPTNHLDHNMASWLELELKKYSGSIIMVTHDRYFLDCVSNRIIEIDKGAIYSYDCNYGGYLEAKQAREEMDIASERKRQSILRTELAWIQRGARARSTKQKARIERFEQLRDKKGIEEEQKVQMSSVSSRLGKTTIELHNISKAYGEKQLIKDFEYIFLKGDRIGFVGDNGCGKTTLMKMITGMVAPDQGEIVIGPTVKIGYYAQEIVESDDKTQIHTMNPNQRVIDYMKDIAEYVMTKDGQISASKMLERFLFEGEEQYGLIGKLSGGQKRRLNLLRVLMTAPNVLILDEPTNDLDITTLTILEDYLDDFDGIVITISHDRYFLDRTVRRIFAFEGNGKVSQYEGGYTDYMDQCPQDEFTNTNASSNGKKEKKEGQTNQKVKEKKLRFTFQEKKDYETIEEDIEKLEQTIEELDTKIIKNSSNFVELNKLTMEKEKKQLELEEKMERWMYLEELAKEIENL